MTTYLPSPVPTDADLHDGELPFTAFGQYGPGQMDNRVFDQDTWWVDIQGNAHQLSELTSTERQQIIELLNKDADYYWRGAVERMTLGIIADALAGRVSGELLASELGTPTVADLDAYTWLEATPLMRRIKAMNRAG